MMGALNLFGLGAALVGIAGAGVTAGPVARRSRSRTAPERAVRYSRR